MSIVEMTPPFSVMRSVMMATQKMMMGVVPPVKLRMDGYVMFLVIVIQLIVVLTAVMVLDLMFMRNVMMAIPMMMMVAVLHVL